MNEHSQILQYSYDEYQHQAYLQLRYHNNLPIY